MHDAVEARLTDIRQRYTATRRDLVELLVSAERPLSMIEMMAARPDGSQSSIYRNLAVLQGAGAVRRLLGGADFAYFELAEELTEHHHHLICNACGFIRVRLSWAVGVEVAVAADRS